MYTDVVNYDMRLPSKENKMLNGNVILQAK